jgi:siroheme synthase
MLIERGGTVRQRELRAPLDTLVADGPAWSTKGPTLVLIGAAVGRGVAWRDVVEAATHKHSVAVED